MTEKPDPFDFTAVERSLNESATRVSTIWVSFLVFGVYLITTVGTVTHRHLLLQEPVRLAVLNVDLPLVGFFFLAPILFVVLHAYVLIQVLLLGRTAAAYNEVLDHLVESSSGNASIRQRLANTLFAQLFAGSPREREGWLGWLLRTMSWLSLAIAPVLVLVFFQATFLAYHSYLITWTLRLLLVIDLISVFVLWGGTLRPFGTFSSRLAFWRLIAFPSAFFIAAFSWVALTFPGEPHAGWTRSHATEDAREPTCQATSIISGIFPSFDRLSLKRIDLYDEAKFAKAPRAIEEDSIGPYRPRPTRDLARRDFDCADFMGADLRGVSFERSLLRGADLYWAHLERANLELAQLNGALLFQAQLDEAFLEHAFMPTAYLAFAQLNRASLERADLQGADLRHAEIQGASLGGAHLPGADLSGALLRGAELWGAQLQGAVLDDAQLQAASLQDTDLQGASLIGADLSGAFLYSSGLQGADLKNAVMQAAKLSGTFVWRAKNAACMGAVLTSPVYDQVLRTVDFSALYIDQVTGTVPASLETIGEFIAASVAGLSHQQLKDAVGNRMRSGLIARPGEDDTATEPLWRNCEKMSGRLSEEDINRTAGILLRALFCDAKDAGVSSDAIARGMLRNYHRAPELFAAFADAVLGNDTAACPTSKDLAEDVRERLRNAIAARRPSPAYRPRAERLRQ